MKPGGTYQDVMLFHGFRVSLLELFRNKKRHTAGTRRTQTRRRIFLLVHHFCGSCASMTAIERLTSLKREQLYLLRFSVWWTRSDDNCHRRVSRVKMLLQAVDYERISAGKGDRQLRVCLRPASAAGPPRARTECAAPCRLPTTCVVVEFLSIFIAPMAQSLISSSVTPGCENLSIKLLNNNIESENLWITPIC